MRTAMLIAGAMFALSGCTLVNTVDYSHLDASIGGDADSGDGGDTGLDGGDADAEDADADVDSGPHCSDMPEDCSNTFDDNCNGLIDCNDFACAQLEKCCARDMRGSLPYSSDPTWDVIPSVGTGSPLTDGTNITDFVGNGSPTGYLSWCLPLEGGYEFSTVFTLQGATCSSAGADCFARVALTASPDSVSGSRIGGSLGVDLGVEMTKDGHLIVTTAKETLETENIQVPVLGWVKAVVTLTTGVNEVGEGWLVATVTAAQSGAVGAGATLVENLPIAPLARLLDSPGPFCSETRGLRLAVEGIGAQIQVGPIETTVLQCLNLGRFTTPAPVPPATASHGPLSAGGDEVADGNLQWTDWGTGGVGAPSLVRKIVGVDTYWHVFGDSTDLDRSEEGATPISFRIGHSSSADVLWNDDPWDTAEHMTTGVPVPRFGPECTSSPCWSDGYSVREPSVIDIGTPGSFVMAAAVRVDAGMRDVYGLFVNPINIDKTVQFNPVASILPGDIAPAGTCISLRHPALVDRDPDEATGYWLFFTCERATEPLDIRVMELDEGFMPVGSPIPQVVTPIGGTFSQSAVYAPEVLADYDSSIAARHTFRMWFLARNRDQDVSVGMAQAQLTDAQVSGGLPPVFELYGANPVLEDGPSFFDGCANCRTTGLTVLRVPGTSTLRFLFARADNEGEPWDRGFVPAEQFWRASSAVPMSPP